MRNGYIKLDASPPLEMPSPYCGACGIEVGEGAYEMVCPCCGTKWPTDAEDGDEGALDPTADGPRVSSEDAHLWGAWKLRMEIFRLAPGVFPDGEPKKPETQAWAEGGS